MKFYPYHYYATPDSPPALCEVSEIDYVFMFHDESYRPKSVYGGRFVKLVEAQEDEAVKDGHNIDGRS